MAWFISHLQMVPTPFIYSVMDLLGTRPYLSRVPLSPSGEDAADADGPCLWVGGLPLPWHIRELREKGVTAIVNCCEEFGGWGDLYEELGMEQCRVAVVDYTNVPLDELVTAVEFVKRKVDAGESVYIHCKAGRGRSASVAVAYLAKYGAPKLRSDEGTPTAGLVANDHVLEHRAVVQCWKRPSVKAFLQPKLVAAAEAEAEPAEAGGADEVADNAVANEVADDAVDVDAADDE